MPCGSDAIRRLRGGTTTAPRYGAVVIHCATLVSPSPPRRTIVTIVIRALVLRRTAVVSASCTGDVAAAVVFAGTVAGAVAAVVVAVVIRQDGGARTAALKRTAGPVVGVAPVLRIAVHIG